jgi:hypothetical protein
MTYFVELADDDDDAAAAVYGRRGRPDTDLSEGNASRHATEDFRRAVDPQDSGLMVDPCTGEPIVLP